MSGKVHWLMYYATIVEPQHRECWLDLAAQHMVKAYLEDK